MHKIGNPQSSASFSGPGDTKFIGQNNHKDMDIGYGGLRTLEESKRERG